VKRLLFGIVGWNIAETTRMIEVAKAFREEFECHFFSYGGAFEGLVEQENFILHRLEPREDQAKIDHLWKVDRGETFKQPWTVKELRQRIQAECALIESLHVEAAFLGSVLTFSTSCKRTHTYLFNVIPLALSKPYLEAGLPISPFWPKSLNRMAGWMLLNLPLLMRNIQQVSKEYGVDTPRTFLDLWTGDTNFVAETQPLSLLKTLPKGWYFSGPLFAYLRNDIPPDIQKILDQTDRKKLYFSMGSSANRSVLLRALEALEAFDGWVIAPIRAHLTLEDKIPSNVIVCDWLPALQVNEKVDAALIHGGQGTVQTTVMAGVPFVGIGMQPEQDMNIYLYVQFGNALQLKKKNFTKQHVLESLNLILTEDTYRKKAQEASLILKNTDTIAIIKSVVLSTLKEIKK